MNSFEKIEAGRMVEVSLGMFGCSARFFMADTVERVTKRHIVLRRYGYFSRRTGIESVAACAPEHQTSYIETPAA